MDKRPFIEKTRGEFSRSPVQKHQINRLIKRKMFLYEIESEFLDVLRSLYEKVFVPCNKYFPIKSEQYDIINEIFESKVLEVWDEKDGGRRLAQIKEAIAANQTQDAKQLRIHREIAAYKSWDSQHEDCSFWQGLEILESEYPDLIALCGVVRGWSQEWNLESDFFCDLAIKTMHHWAIDVKELDEGEDPNFTEWGGLSGYGGQTDTNLIGEPSFVPSQFFPAWRPFQQRLKDYLEGLRKQLKTVITNDPLGALTSDGYLNSHLEAFLDSLIEYVKTTYCNKLIEYYESQGFDRFGKKTRADEHTKWTIRVRLFCHTDEEVAQVFKAIAKESGLQVKAIKKAVTENLLALGLPLHPTIKKKGRPSKNHSTKKQSDYTSKRFSARKSNILNFSESG